MRNRVYALLLTTVAFWMTGCVRSVQPVLQDEQVISGDAWIGTWVNEDKETFVLAVPKEGTPDVPEKAYSAVYVEKDGSVGTFFVRFGKVGNMTIAEARPTNPRPEASDAYRAHLLPLYSFGIVKPADNGDVTLSFMDSDWLKTYLAAHPNELPTISADKDDRILNAPTATLQAFIQQHAADDGAFGKQVMLHRLASSTQASSQ